MKIVLWVLGILMSVCGILLAATPLLKGLTDFRPLRIAMLRAEKVDELFAILDKIEETYG